MIVRCARCGKAFNVTEAGWGYGYDGLLTCTYRCMREMEKEDGMSEKNTKSPLTDEERAKIDEMAGQGFDNGAIAAAIERPRAAVGAYLGRKKRREAPEAEPKAAPEAVTAILRDAEARTGDELELAVIRLMTDMVGIIKRIVWGHELR